MTSSASPTQLPLDIAEMTIPAEGLVRRTILPNGLRILTESMPGVRSASIGFWVQIGSRDEDPVRYGSTHFLEHLLFKGTPTRSALEIATHFDSIGGDHNALTGKELTCYYARVRDIDVPGSLEILIDMVVSSVLDPQEFELERGVILEELAMASDDPEDVAHERFAELAYPGHPLGRPIGGTQETIGAVTRAHVLEHYRASYWPGRIVFTAAGGVDHDAIVAQLAAAFSDAGLAAAGHPAPRRGVGPAAIGGGAGASVTRRPTEQENIVIGVPGISRSDPRRFALAILNAVFGTGMSSRLFQEVREKRGLAYSVYSFCDSYSDAGAVGMYVGCQPGKAAEAVRVLLGEFERLAADGISEEELRRGAGQLTGQAALGLEDSYARMNRLGRSEIGSGEFFGLDASIRQIEAVTVEEVSALAGELAGGPIRRVAVGPLDEAALGWS